MNQTYKTKINGSRLASLALALIPVAMFIAVAANLVWMSIPALTQVGLGNLFSLKFSTVFSGGYVPGQYGLIPALWGTFLLILQVQLIAFPISLAMAILASEFSLGGFGKIIELILAFFSGIPPILYGLLSIFVLTAFVRPKFGAENLDPGVIMNMLGEQSWVAGILPREESTFLGGIMISLLIIPFMAPIILDAIRGVSPALKESSLALGASRWYTLWRSTLPAATSGIVTAISLGVLKTMGELIIAAWTIGYLADGLPAPIFDVLEDKAPLTSTAAALLSGGLRPNSGPRNTLDGPVAYFGSLILLVAALLILVLVNAAQRSIRRRLGNGR